MTLYELIKDHQQRKRLNEILHVFFEEEFGYLISRIKLHHHLPFHKRLQARIAKEKNIDHPVRLRKAFERLGPTFIKFGQLLSLRPDLVPPEFVAEFEKMQDKVPLFSYSAAKRIIEGELKKPLNQVFSYFPKIPIASASIAQVYKAKLGNKTVAVKVQRPGIDKQIRIDIGIMYKLAELLERHIPSFKAYHLKGIVHEFEKWSIKELNFNIEAYYAQKISQNFKNSRILKIPKIYPNLTTNKLLTMEFLEGIPLHDIERLKKKRFDIKKIIRNGYYVVLKQVFIDGFFHADPHPGNILILDDGKIGLIDFGILGHFDKKLKQYALNILRSFINNDPDKAVAVFLQMNSASEDDFGFIDKEAFRNDVRDVFEQLLSTPLEELQIGPLLRETISIANKHHLQIPADFVLYGKTIAILEGIALRYQPDFNYFQETKSILGKMLDYSYFAKEAIENTKTKLSEYKELAEVFPETVREILEKARKFKLSIDIEEKDVRDLTLEMEHSSGNLSLGLIIAALIVGSSWVMQTSQLVYLSTIGFILAGILGLWLIQRTIFIKKRAIGS